MGKLQLLDHYAEGDKQIAVHGQDISSVFNFNEEQRKYSDENWAMADEDIKPVARIPRVVWLALNRKGITDTEQAQELMNYLEAHPWLKRTEKQIGKKPTLIFDMGR